jgi:hypothetical protein
MKCAADPNVETELRCGKCDTPICPRCMIQTPVGARCRSCANLRRPAMYTVSPVMVARGAAAALAVAVVVGGLWAVLLPRAATFLGFFIFFAAAGYGWLVSKAIGRATNRRRGSALQAVAVVSCILVYLVHNVLTPPNALVLQNDVFGYIFVVIAAVVGAGYLR